MRKMGPPRLISFFSFNKTFKHSMPYYLNSYSLVFLVFSMILLNNGFVFSHDSENKVCDQKYYSKPKCIDQTDFYKCKCNEGFVWNGETCVSTSINSYFEFSEKLSSGYVLLEKTFPKLNSFTIATWLQVHNYNLTSGGASSSFNNQNSFLGQQRTALLFQNDSRTIFTYSLENFVNLLRCKIASIAKSKAEHARKINANLFITVNVFNYQCGFRVSHVYMNNSFWMHLTITWSSLTGKMYVYINGQLKSSCSDIALNREINTAGAFILGQSHHDNFFSKKTRKYAFDYLSTTSKSALNDAYRSDDADEHDKEGEWELDDDSNAQFDLESSFVGRIFNFNVWTRQMQAHEISDLYADCRLAHCGDATQWSDFRPGTRGNVTMRWPTDLLWKVGHSATSCFSDVFQFESCNNYCNREIGPICREHVDKNVRWPLTKANETARIKCFEQSNEQSSAASAHAVRHCRLRRRSSSSSSSRGKKNKNEDENRSHTYLNSFEREFVAQSAEWSAPNIDACVQDPLLMFKHEVHSFCTTDNFDETQLISYAEELYDLSMKHVKLANKKSIYDVSALIDTMQYLISAQHQIIKRSLDVNLNLVYPTYEDTMDFSSHILAVVDLILSLSSNKQLWEASLPIGSESYRLIELVNQLSASIYDFQLLSLITYEQQNENYAFNIFRSLKQASNKSKDSTPRADNDTSKSEQNDEILPFLLIDIKYSSIAYRQQFLFHEQQMPLNFKFPQNKDESASLEKTKSSLIKKSFKNKNKTKTNNQAKMTTSTTLYQDYDPEFSTTTTNTPKKYTLEKFKAKIHLEQSNSTNQPATMAPKTPFLYLGKVNFNDNNLKLLLSNNKDRPNIIESSYSLLTVYYSGLENLLPNHNKTLYDRPKDNNVNSIVLTVSLIGSNGQISMDKSNFNRTLSKPIQAYFNYFTNFNTSDTRCVFLTANRERNAAKAFKWSRQECEFKEKNFMSAKCSCYAFGTYTITNDLYDPDWKPIKLENRALELPSYLGCIIVSLLCAATFACLTYLRAKSATTSIHKNLCVSICVSQVLIMISLTEFKFDRLTCQTFALLNHYMLFVVFAWLSNEAFNLYITITYAAHQSSPIANDHGSQWRFYLIGYLLPALMLLILFVIKSNSYYDAKLCWFNLDNLWINISPMISMIAISCLVMIFSAKEHTESSYTKNAKANKLVANHTRGVWTQLVLLTTCWTFAFMSLKIFGSIIKYLYGFLNCLQGMFLFIFFVLVNEEVKKYLKERRRKKKLKLKDVQAVLHSGGVAVKTANLDDEEEEDEEEEESEDEDVFFENNSNKTKTDSPVTLYESSRNLTPTTKPHHRISPDFHRDFANSFSSSANKSLMKLSTRVDSVKSRDSPNKNVKFQRGLGKNSSENSSDENQVQLVLSSTMVRAKTNGPCTKTSVSLVKPSQLGLKSITTPAAFAAAAATSTTEADDYEQKYLKSVTKAMNENEARFTNANIEHIVWPQFRKKLQTKSPSHKPSEKNCYNSPRKDAAYHVNVSGRGSAADFYDSAEVKVTVL